MTTQTELERLKTLSDVAKAASVAARDTDVAACDAWDAHAAAEAASDAAWAAAREATRVATEAWDAWEAAEKAKEQKS